MKRLMLLAALGAGLAVSACEEPASPDVETAPLPMEDTVAPSAEDQGVPAADTTAPTEAPPPVDTLPEPPKSSEQTVQPESETLFY
jgi:hypothetical protein